MRSVSFVLALGPLVAQGLTYEPHARMEGGYPTCEVSSRESCPLSRMPKDRSTVVYPGGATRCISTKTPYGFQVIPGDASKLLVFFQGGGACWDAGATKDSLCTETAEPSYESGIFDRTNAKNPYREHTVVQTRFKALMDLDWQRQLADFQYRVYQNIFQAQSKCSSSFLASKR